MRSAALIPLAVTLLAAASVLATPVHAAERGSVPVT